MPVSVYSMYGFGTPRLGEPNVGQVGAQTGTGSTVNVGVPITAYPSQSTYGVATPQSAWASFATVSGQVPAASFPAPTLAPISYVGFGTGAATPLGPFATGQLNTFGGSLMNINSQNNNLMNTMAGGGGGPNPLGQMGGGSGVGGPFGAMGTGGTAGMGTGSVDQGGPVDQAMLSDLIRKRQMMIETYSNIMKSLHDGLMGPIRNIRG